MSNITTLRVNTAFGEIEHSFRVSAADCQNGSSCKPDAQWTSSDKGTSVEQPASWATIFQGKIQLYIPCGSDTRCQAQECTDRYCDYLRGQCYVETHSLDEISTDCEKHQNDQRIQQPKDFQSARDLAPPSQSDNQIKSISYYPSQSESEYKSQIYSIYGPNLADEVDDTVCSETHRGSIDLCDASTCTTSDSINREISTANTLNGNGVGAAAKAEQCAINNKMRQYTLSLSELYQNGVFETFDYVRGHSAAGGSARTSRADEHTDSGLEASEGEPSVSPELSIAPPDRSALAVQSAESQLEPNNRERPATVSPELDRDEEYVIVFSENIGIDNTICRSLGNDPEHFQPKKQLVTKHYSASTDSALFSECCSLSSDDLSEIATDFTYRIDVETSSVKSALSSLANENNKQLQLQKTKTTTGANALGEDTRRLVLPTGLLELSRRLHLPLELETDSMSEPRTDTNDLYTVLGGTVRGYPASWSSLVSQMTPHDPSLELGPQQPALSNPQKQEPTPVSDSVDFHPDVLDNEKHHSAIAEWTVGRRRATSTAFGNNRLATTKTTRALINNFPDLPNGLTGGGGKYSDKSSSKLTEVEKNVCKTAAVGVDDEIGDEWYPRCGQCGQLVYPQDSLRLVSHTSVVYHAQCLRCSQCQQPAVRTTAAGPASGTVQAAFNGQQQPRCELHSDDRCQVLELRPQVDRIKSSTRPQMSDFGGKFK